MFRGFQKCTEICRYLFPSLRYFNFSKDVFKTEISKNDKIGKPLCESSKTFLDLKTSDIVDNAWECAHKLFKRLKRHYDVINMSVLDDATTQKHVF